MKLIKIFYLLLFTLTIFGCKKNNEFKQENKTKFKQYKRVYLNGTSDDPKALQFFIIMNEAYLFGSNHKYIKKEIKNDSLHIILDSISKSQIMKVMAMGDSLYLTRMFVTPGDSIAFKIKDRNFQFTGKNAIYNNFFGYLDNEVLKYYENPYQGNIQTYKKTTKSIYDQKVIFFKKYIEKNKIHSNDFTETIRADLKFEYLYYLDNPPYIKAKTTNMYYGDGSGVLATIAGEEQNEKLFDEKEYFDHISIEDFNRPNLLNNNFYKNVLNSIIRHYFVTNDHIDYSKEKFIAEKEFIQMNFDGDIESYAIARMISDYNAKGFGYSIGNQELLRGLIDDYESKFIKSSYKEKMDKIIKSLDNFDFRLPKDALQSKLINPIGDTITLGEVFKRTSKKIRVIDFWASWCSPCIVELKKANEFKNKLSDKDHVEWIYISIDKDYKTWVNKSLELQEFFNVENQYFLLGGKFSPLGKSLKISSIPRYVIFDKNERIVLDNAPRPSDSIIFKRVIDDINKKN